VFSIIARKISVRNLFFVQIEKKRTKPDVSQGPEVMIIPLFSRKEPELCFFFLFPWYSHSPTSTVLSWSFLFGSHSHTEETSKKNIKEE